jgi:hypothetical protein
MINIWGLVLLLLGRWLRSGSLKIYENLIKGQGGPDLNPGCEKNQCS